MRLPVKAQGHVRLPIVIRSTLLEQFYCRFCRNCWLEPLVIALMFSRLEVWVLNPGPPVSRLNLDRIPRGAIWFASRVSTEMRALVADLQQLTADVRSIATQNQRIGVLEQRILTLEEDSRDTRQQVRTHAPR